MMAPAYVPRTGDVIWTDCSSRVRKNIQDSMDVLNGVSTLFRK